MSVVEDDVSSTVDLVEVLDVDDVATSAAARWTLILALLLLLISLLWIVTLLIVGVP